MKTKFLLLSLCLVVVFVGAGCNTQNQTINNMASNSNSHAGMNHGAGNMPANRQEMNHGEMNHSEMKSSSDAANAPYDLQFIDTMIAHHEGAVVMAKPAVEKAVHGELRTLAQNIVSDQEKEIAQMRRWREEWFAGKPPAMNMEMAGMVDSMKDMDMKKLETASGAAFDLAFIEMMIPHHDGAVLMAKEALQKSQRQEIKTLANAIIKAQEAEIKKMKDWQAAWSK